MQSSLDAHVQTQDPSTRQVPPVHPNSTQPSASQTGVQKLPVGVTVQKPSTHEGIASGVFFMHGPQNFPGPGVASHVGSSSPVLEVLAPEFPPVGTPVSETLSVTPGALVLGEVVPWLLVSPVEPLQPRQEQRSRVDARVDLVCIMSVSVFSG